MERRVAIIGQAQIALPSEKSFSQPSELIFPTAFKALESAGITRDAIDVVIGAGCDTMDGRSISNVFTVESMGGFLKEESKVEEDGAYAAYYALLRLLGGQFKTALVVAYSKSSECHPQYYTHQQCDPILLRPLGLEGVSFHALQAQRYKDFCQVKDEDVAHIVVKNRANGKRNSRAILQQTHTVEEVLASPVLCSPIRRLEAPPLTDGCTAIVLATEEFCSGGTQRPPVWIEGAGLCSDAYYPGHRDLADTRALRKAAEQAYRMAGITDPRREFDLAEVSENFAYQELMVYEGLKFCLPGEGPELLKDGSTEFDGPMPVNPSGGLLCSNPILAAGLTRMAEAYLQLTGTAGEHQVPDAKRAVVHASSGLCLQSNIVYVLGR